MKNIIYSLIFTISILNFQEAFSQSFEWANQVELVAYDNVAAIVHLGHDTERDAEGNVYMAGSFAGTQKFGDSTLVSSQIGGIVFSEDGFIAKYSSSGEFLWVESFPATMLGSVYDIELDVDGNIYALMHFLDTISVLNTQVVADEGFVIAKMDASLNLLWSKTISRVGSQNFMFPGELELSANDVFVTGEANDEVTLEGTILNDEFPTILVSLDQQNGALNWSDNLGYDEGDLATDGAGNVYWGFNYPIAQNLNPIQIGNVSVNSINGPVMVLVKYDALGNITSTKAFGSGGDNPNQIQQIDVNPASGDIYLAGTWGDTLNLDGMELTSQISASNGSILWLAKYNSNEEIQWIKRSHLPANVAGNINSPFIHIDSSPDGGIFISSETANNTDFTLGEGTNAVSFVNTVDGFIAKYASNGELEWGQKLDCTEVNCDLYVRGLTAIDDNQATLTGSFSRQFDLGEVSLTAVVPSTVQHPNIYLIKVDGDLMTSTENPITKHLQFKIYPNPATDFLQIKISTPEFEDGQIEIFDLIGQVLLQSKLSQNTDQISISNLSNGTYFLKIIGDDFNGVQKFIIQK